MKKSSSVQGAPKPGNGSRAARPPAPEPTPRDPRKLVRAEWIAVILLIGALAAAPLWVGTFANPPSTRIAVSGSIADDIGYSLVAMLTAVALALVAAREIQRPVAVGAVRALAPAVALWAIWSAVSMSRSQALYLSANAWVALLTAVLVGGLISRLARDGHALTALLAAVISIGALIGAMALNEYVGQYMQGDPDHRVFATFVNPDFLAGYMLLVVPITLSAFLTARDRVFRLGLALALLVETAAVPLSGSRAGAGILIVSIVIWLLLASAGRALTGKGRPLIGALVLMCVALAFASAPTLSRLFAPSASGPTNVQAAAASAAQAQSHSAAFRKYTWMGTVAMATANPLFGSGLGTFEVAYPRYAETAYTEHAHNSYLQIAAETGFPGLLLLLTAFAAVSAFGFYVLILPDSEPVMAPTSPESGWEAFDRPRLMLVGLLASVVASLAHSFFDSDWYIVGTAVTLAAVVGLLVAQARAIAVLAVTRPKPLPKAALIGCFVIAAGVFWRAGVVAHSRVEIEIARKETHQGLAAASQSQRPENAYLDSAVDAYRQAIGADPLDPEPRLALAQLYIAQGRWDDAEPLLKEATRLANTGRAWYRLGQFYETAKAPASAVDAFERARELEPKNVQTLRALGTAQAEAGQIDRARETLQEATALETAPYGTVRAVPELVETEFAYIHAKLGDIEAASGNLGEAQTEYDKALDVLRQYWKKRHLLVMQSISPEKRDALAVFYDETLTKLEGIMNKLGDPSGAAEAEKEQEKLKQDRQDDAAAQEKEQAGAPDRDSGQQ